MKTIAAVLLAVALSACAVQPPAPVERRYLTAEEDAQLRANCEKVEGGCVMIPAPIWEKIKAILERVMRGDVSI